MIVIGTAALAQHGFTAGPDIDLVGTLPEVEALIAGIDRDQFYVNRFDTAPGERVFFIVQELIFGLPGEKVCSIDADITGKLARQMMQILPHGGSVSVMGVEVPSCSPETQWCIYEALRGTWGWKDKYQSNFDMLGERIGALSLDHKAFIAQFRGEVISEAR